MPRTRLRRYFRHGLLPQLIVFESVARLGSVTRAAEELHLAQPTVSTQLKKLAATLEVALFDRRGRCLQLTAGGEALRESCFEIFAAFRRIDDSLAGFRSYNSQPVVEDGEWRASTTRR
ncbi:MAG TPA: LysR family transcriptional regulator [Burkholderiales bacterium]|nr:LysR family transcriptional regulator [Burkholderiales bacterium]